LRAPDLEDFDVEEVYHRLSQDRRRWSKLERDLISREEAEGAIGEAFRGEVEEKWRRALAQSAVLARSVGKLSLGMERISGLGHAAIDWRTALWRFLGRAAADFSGWDRRYVYRGLYLEALESEEIDLRVCIDTSGSISNPELSGFLSEVDAIRRAYRMGEGRLYFADADIYGPYELDPSAPLPPAKGGGGTSFCPFFQTLKADRARQALAVYLTDGYGSFPTEDPEGPVLWVVSRGGAADHQFPFGEVIRLP
jgi:predicted metal-dependent peptidase